MAEEFDVPETDQTDGSTDFVFTNYPLEGDDSAVMQLVAFGPASEDFNLLINMNPNDGVLNITVGNGPDHREAPTLIAETLHDIAQIVSSLNDNPEYQAAVEAAEGE